MSFLPLGLLAHGLLAAQQAAPEVTVLVPWRGEQLLVADWLDRHGFPGPFQVQVSAGHGLDARDLREAAVLLGYREIDVARLEDAALLADGGEGPFHLAWWESWAPASHTVGSGNEEAVGSWADLLRHDLRPRVYLRFPEAGTPELCILAQVATDYLTPGSDLEPLVFTTPGDANALSPYFSYAQVLQSLPEGALTIAPVRDVVREQRRGEDVAYWIPGDGFLAFRAGLAITTAGAEAGLREAALRLLEPDPLGEICRELDLEPALPVTGGLPAWIDQEVAPARRPLDPGQTAVLQEELLESYTGGGDGFALPEFQFFNDLFDWLTLVFFAGFFFFAARMLRR